MTLTKSKNFLLERDGILPGDLYFKKRSGKLFKILNLGELYTKEIQKKYQETVSEFLIDDVTNEEIFNKGKELLFKIDSSVSELERNGTRKEFLALVMNSPKAFKLFDVMYLFSYAFKVGSEKSVHELSNATTSQFKRSMVVGTLNCIAALAIGVADFIMLRDLFLLPVIYDRGLLIPVPDYQCETQLEALRLDPRVLLAMRLDYQNNYTKHPDVDVESTREDFSYGGSANFNRFHHAGDVGIAKELQFDDLTETQKIIIICNKLVTYSEINFNEELWEKWSGMIKAEFKGIEWDAFRTTRTVIEAA